MKRISVVIVIALLVLAIFQVNLQTQTFASSTFSLSLTTSCPENVTVYFLDVGQGDSILVKTPTKNVLIDGGPTEAGATLLNYLSTYHVTKIDLLVATHPHADHIGGLVSLLQSTMPVQDIVYNGYNYTSTATFNTWKNLALTHNLTQGNRNQIYSISPTINFTVISPTNPTQFGSATNEINDNSIVMKLQVGNTSAMFTGDAQFDSEQSMLSSGFDLHSQVLKVGHHGSSTSTSQAFLSAVIPAYAVISAGINNQYGHPTQQTLDILSSNNIITYGTYSYGTIIFSLNSASQPQLLHLLQLQHLLLHQLQLQHQLLHLLQLLRLALYQLFQHTQLLHLAQLQLKLQHQQQRPQMLQHKILQSIQQLNQPIIQHKTQQLHQLLVQQQTLHQLYQSYHH